MFQERSLVEACQKGDYSSVLALIKRGVNINCLVTGNNGDEWTPLMIASAYGHTNVVKLLLDYGATVHITNNNGWTALMTASVNRQLEAVKMLLDHSANVNMMNNDGLTVLMAASQNGHIKTAKLLLHHGAKVDMVHNDGWTALMGASLKGHVETAKLLLQHGAKVDLAHNDGWTALMLGSRDGHIETTKLLLDHGATVDMADNNGTALMAASRNGHIKTAKLLLDHGATVDMTNNNGWTALMAVSENGQVEAAKLLLDRGATVDMKTIKGWTALMLASVNGQIETAKLLLECGATVDMTNNDGWTALMVASLKGHVETAKLLLDCGAKVDMTNNNGWTALMVASYNGNVETANLLLEHDALVDMTNEIGMTALIVASENGRVEIAKLLLDHGAQAHFKCDYGQTALSLARSPELLNMLMLAMTLQLVDLLQPVAHRWRNLGKLLGLKETALNTIQVTIEEEKDCLQAIVGKWLKPQPAWRALIRALKTVDSDLAKKVNDLVGPSKRSFDKEDNEEESDSVDYEKMNEAKHLAAVERAMKEKGTLNHAIAHVGFLGPAGSGKSCLMTRLVGEMPSSNSPSTGVADRVVQVKVTKSSSFAVCAFESQCNASPTRWWKILYDEEAVFLMGLSTHTMSYSTPNTSPSDSLPATPKSSGNTPSHVPSSISSISHTLQDATAPSTVPVKSDSVSSKSGSVPVKSDTVSLPSRYVPPLGLFKHALQHGQFEVFRQHFENSWSLYLTDTGGQMEFQELFPLMMSGPSIFFFIFRLDQGLSQRFTIEYRLPDGGRSEAYQSTLTVEEALLQTLASVASMGTFTYKGPQMESVPLKPKVMIVGTHKDRLDKATAQSTIKEIDKHLQKLIKSTSHYRKDLVEFASESQLIYTVNNFSEDDSDFQDIRTGVERRGLFKTSLPSHWLIFSFVLRQPMFKERIISYEQCFAIAQDCGIADRKELDHALWFLHTKIGLVRHFPTPGLSDIVIRDPQILFDKVTQLILKTFTFKIVGERPLDEFKKQGIFHFEDFAKVGGITDPSLVKFPSLLTPEKLVELLEHLRIVAPFEDENGQTKYFLPCVLAHSEASKSQYLPHSLDIPPLLITFKCGYCPKGLYGALITYLLVNEMRSEFTWELKTDQIFRDQVTFRVGNHDIITLKIHPTYLEFIHSSPPSMKKRSVESVCVEIRRSIEKGIRKISSDLNFTSDAKHSLSFYCENTDCLQKMGPHPATEIVIEETPAIMWCKRSVHVNLDSHPPDNYSVWFNGRESEPKDVAPLPTLKSRRRDRPDDVDDNAETVDFDLLSGDPKRQKTDCNRPTLANLTLLKWRDDQGQAQKLRLIQSVSPEWRKLGALVGLTAPQIQSLSQKHQLDPERCCTDVFGIHWLENPPPNYPATWEGLGELLEDLELSQVAKSLQLALQQR